MYLKRDQAKSAGYRNEGDSQYLRDGISVRKIPTSPHAIHIVIKEFPELLSNVLVVPCIMYFLIFILR